MQDELYKLAISLLVGSLLGIEREYHNKAAGLRTIALICVGATIFTLLSIRMGNDVNSADRIASNIITGIGFIGAGVIYRIGITVEGLTTAATIWISAALGMAIGAGDYPLAWSGLAIALAILALFDFIQNRVLIFPQRRLYTIRTASLEDMLAIENELKEHQLSFSRLKEKRSDEGFSFQYEVRGHKTRLAAFDDFLLSHKPVLAFEYE